MSNPFSAPPSKPLPNPAERLATPPPLVDEGNFNSLSVDAEAESILPPVRNEIESQVIHAPGSTALPPVQKSPFSPLGDAPKTTPVTNSPLPKVAAQSADVAVSFTSESTESKFDLEVDDPGEPLAAPAPKETKLVNKLESEAKPDFADLPASSPKPTPIVAAHHQPTSTSEATTISPVGWSEADFPDHDPSDLPSLDMDEKSCRMCKFYQFDPDLTRSETLFGECRFNAPAGVGKAIWPSVLWDSWCGVWKMGVSQDEMMQMARSVSDKASDKELNDA